MFEFKNISVLSEIIVKKKTVFWAAILSENYIPLSLIIVNLRSFFEITGHFGIYSAFHNNTGIITIKKT